MNINFSQDFKKEVFRKEDLISEMNKEWKELRETVKKLHVYAYSVGIDTVN